MNKEMIVSYWEGKLSPHVISAFKGVMREHFVAPAMARKAYDDVPLPILRGKTISQPSTVLLMTEALQLTPGMRVLEIGAGSGYQAAILGTIAFPGLVYSTEVIPELVRFARSNLTNAGITNVHVLEHDGSQGLAEHAPYDRIIFTAACPSDPLHLTEQLADDGVMIAPVGPLDVQQMVRFIKHDGIVQRHSLGEFVFSPLVGTRGFAECDLP